MNDVDQRSMEHDRFDEPDDWDERHRIRVIEGRLGAAEQALHKYTRRERWGSG